MSPNDSQKIIDLIIPVYNEAGVVEHTYRQICEVIKRLPFQFHIFFVDDGSTVGTPDSLAALARQDSCVTVLTLARNFGHQAALTAGLDASSGDFVILVEGGAEDVRRRGRRGGIPVESLEGPRRDATVSRTPTLLEPGT